MILDKYFDDVYFRQLLLKATRLSYYTDLSEIFFITNFEWFKIISFLRSIFYLFELNLPIKKNSLNVQNIISISDPGTWWQVSIPSQTRRWSRLNPNCYGYRQTKKTKPGRNRGIPKPRWVLVSTKSWDCYGTTLNIIYIQGPDKQRTIVLVQGIHLINLPSPVSFPDFKNNIEKVDRPNNGITGDNKAAVIEFVPDLKAWCLNIQPEDLFKVR